MLRGKEEEINLVTALLYTSTIKGQSVPGESFLQDESSVCGTDQTSAAAGRRKGGGVCFLINNRWLHQVLGIKSGASNGHEQTFSILLHFLRIERVKEWS